MKSPWLIVLFAVGFMPIPAWAALPQLTLACAAAQAGQDAPCVISRADGSAKGVYVLFATSGGTARAGIDYTAIQQQVYLKGGQQSVTVLVHTLVNPAASGTLSFGAAITNGLTVIRATGSIIEPSPAPAPSPSPVPLAVGVTAKLICPGSCSGEFRVDPTLIAGGPGTGYPPGGECDVYRCSVPNGELVTLVGSALLWDGRVQWEVRSQSQGDVMFFTADELQGVSQ